MSITSGLASGDALLPTLNISSQIVSYTSSPLTISFSNTLFGARSGTMNTGISGQTQYATVGFSTFADANDALFGTGTLLSSNGPFSSTINSSASNHFSMPAPFSVTELITISPGKISLGSISRFSTTFVDPPDGIAPVADGGSTLALFALALVGIGIAGRRLATS